MKEFMFFIRKEIDSNFNLTALSHFQFLKSCESYISKLQSEGRLISAQPLIRTGVLISKNENEWKEVPFNEYNEIIGGYYHILAKDINEAISIAKLNPEFEFNPETRIEIRPVKIDEEETGYLYPQNSL